MKHATNSVYQSYFHALYLSRLAFFGVLDLLRLLPLWSIPWFGIGLSRNDYTPQYVVTMSFAGLLHRARACCTGRCGRMARHKREALVAWNSLYDETTGTHTRSHLYDRLSLECERSERHGSSFALILLKLRPPEPGRGRHGAVKTTKFLRRAADLVQSLTRPKRPRRPGQQQRVRRPCLRRRLRGRRGVAATASRRHSLSDCPASPGTAATALSRVVELGVAMYGRDGSTPEALVDAARAAAQDRDDRPLSPTLASPETSPTRSTT